MVQHDTGESTMRANLRFSARDLVHRVYIRGCMPHTEQTVPDRLFGLLSCRREGCTTAAFDRAAMNNHVHVIMWLTKNRNEGGTESALQWAVSRGHTEVS